MRVVPLVASIVISTTVFACADLILSEVLSNEPGSRVLLEWVEVFNNGPLAIDLADYSIVEGPDTLRLSGGSGLAPGVFAVLCRRLLPLSGSDCFESRWGDSSGVWGDSPGENYPAYEIGIILANASGSIYLLDADDYVADQFHWSSASDDGRSEERDDLADVFSAWHACFDPTGSTPGKENSTRPADDSGIYLDVSPKIISLSAPDQTITISYGVNSGSKVSLEVYDDSGRSRRTISEDSEIPYGIIYWSPAADGRRYAPGLYIIVFKSTGATETRKSIPVALCP